jgi:NAD(P)H dehydrogenase (quinone)
VDILLVVVHPRPDSLTHAVARAFAGAAETGGHRIDWADLHAEGFDPVLRALDEPDWGDPAKRYSPEVRAEMARIGRNAATVIVFPVWWWSMPAMLKGWIDRVWNHGWAYGDGASYPHRKVWMLGVAGGTAAQFAKRGYDFAMVTQIETGVLRYCGVEDARLALLYGTLEDEEAIAAVLDEARKIGAEF